MSHNAIANKTLLNAYDVITHSEYQKQADSLGYTFDPKNSPSDIGGCLFDCRVHRIQYKQGNSALNPFLNVLLGDQFSDKCWKT